MKNPCTNSTLNLKRVVSFVLDVRKVPMKRKLSLLVLLFVTSLTLLALFPAPVKSDFTVIRVPADYASIQLAINAVAPGSIILVSEGIYPKSIVVNKTLTLIGEDKTTTILDGDGAAPVVHIKANNVTFNGFSVQNATDTWLEESGVYIERSIGCAVSGNIIAANGFRGIHLNESSNNLIDGNLILNNGDSMPELPYGEGIWLSHSNNNTIVNNVLSGNVVINIAIQSSYNNLVANNTIEKSYSGMTLDEASEDNAIYHNNFIENSVHVDSIGNDGLSLNIWDDGSVGNYWDDYVGLDNGSGGRVAGDGVGDTDLPHLELDNFPLTVPRGVIPIVWENMGYPVTLLSNSTISEFRFIQAGKKITFTVRGPSDTFGYCNVTIPKNLLRDNPWKIMLNDTDITYQAIITENQTHTSIYFTYTHSNYNVQIIGTWVIPEFSSPIILSLFIITTLLVIIVYRYRKSCFHDSHLKNVRESPRSSRT